MKSTAIQENNQNFKKDSFIPKICSDLAPGVCNNCSLYDQLPSNVHKSKFPITYDWTSTKIFCENSSASLDCIN